MAKKKYIETPEKLWELFTAYKEEVKGNPKTRNDFAGKDAYEVTYRLERPLTMEGFENYLFEKGVISELTDYFSNKEDRYNDYAAICHAIRRQIRADQIEGGMVGIYNPSITQRLNNLTEKVQTENNHKIEALKIEVVNTGVLPASSEKDIKL